jgi:hypothetical protein
MRVCVFVFCYVCVFVMFVCCGEKGDVAMCVVSCNHNEIVCLKEATLVVFCPWIHWLTAPGLSATQRVSVFVFVILCFVVCCGEGERGDGCWSRKHDDTTRLNKGTLIEFCHCVDTFG